MFKNPLKYQQGGQVSQEQQKMLAAFVEWLPKRVKEFQGMQPEQIVEALNGMSKTPEGQKQIEQLMQQFQQEMSGNQSGMFKDGGKLNDFICKHAKGGQIKDCGCNEEGGNIEYAGLGEKLRALFTRKKKEEAPVQKFTAPRGPLGGASVAKLDGFESAPKTEIATPQTGRQWDYSGLSFNQAFKRAADNAADNGSKTFIWNGKKYGTRRSADWKERWGKDDISREISDVLTPMSVNTPIVVPIEKQPDLVEESIFTPVEETVPVVEPTAAARYPIQVDHPIIDSTFWGSDMMTSAQPDAAMYNRTLGAPGANGRLVRATTFAVPSGPTQPGFQNGLADSKNAPAPGEPKLPTINFDPREEVEIEIPSFPVLNASYSVAPIRKQSLTYVEKGGKVQKHQRAGKVNYRPGTKGNDISSPASRTADKQNYIEREWVPDGKAIYTMAPEKKYLPSYMKSDPFSEYSQNGGEYQGNGQMQIVDYGDGSLRVNMYPYGTGDPNLGVLHGSDSAYVVNTAKWLLNKAGIAPSSGLQEKSQLVKHQSGGNVNILGQIKPFKNPVSTTPADSSAVTYNPLTRSMSFEDVNGNKVSWSRNRDGSYVYKNGVDLNNFDPNQDAGYVPYSWFKRWNRGTAGSTKLSKEHDAELNNLIHYIREPKGDELEAKPHVLNQNKEVGIQLLKNENTENKK